MNISKIIAKSRVQSNTSVSQKSDQDMLDDLNTIQDNIFSSLSILNKKYAWNYWHSNLVGGQNEYTIPKEVLDTVGLRRLLKVYVNYGKGNKKSRIFNELQDNLQYSEDNPIAIQRDGSIFIYPTPKQAILGGLKVEGTYRPLQFTLNTESEDIKLSPEYHDIFIFGLNQKNFEDRLLRNDAQFWNNKYEVYLNKIKEQGAMDIDGWSHEEDSTSILDQYS